MASTAMPTMEANGTNGSFIASILTVATAAVYPPVVRACSGRIPRCRGGKMGNYILDSLKSKRPEFGRQAGFLNLSASESQFLCFKWPLLIVVSLFWCEQSFGVISVEKIGSPPCPKISRYTKCPQTHPFLLWRGELVSLIVTRKSWLGWNICLPTPG